MKKAVIIFLFLCLQILQAYSASISAIHSLKSTLIHNTETSGPDTIRVNILNQLCDKTYGQEPTKAKVLAEEALKLPRKIEYK